MNERIEKVDILEMSIAKIHSAIEKGELTSKQLVSFYISRIESMDRKGPCINSVININPSALTIAEKLDRQYKQIGLTGPLHGIPVLLKDNICTKGLETTAGSLSLEGFIPSRDAEIVSRLVKDGAIILAKTNLHEFAVWGETYSSKQGQTLNPYDLTRTPGGSSGGTGAGVAANFGVIGIGTDTVNSIRSPASACSLVGLRPTKGLVSTKGIIPYSSTQDTAGPITRTVEDAVKCLQSICDNDSICSDYLKHLKPNGLKGKRIGLLRSLFGNEKKHEEVNSVMALAIKDMVKHGASTVEIEDRINADDLVNSVSVHLHELKCELNQFLQSQGNLIKMKDFEGIMNSGLLTKDVERNFNAANKLAFEKDEYIIRLERRNNLRDRITKIMVQNEVDALAFPHQKCPVVKVGEAQIDRNGVIAAITGFPSSTLPAGFTHPTANAPTGVPVGIEFLAKEFDEATLIEISYGFEKVTQRRKPPVLISS
ncbi:MAG: amidase [Tindallia sp. MSAO_Bac2]|nr:MAG: amidase [Tindallia sp. MSAO_Bac2]